MGGAEQRKHKRSKFPFDGIIDSSDMSMLSEIVNISVSGVLCRTTTPVPELITVDMSIELPTAKMQAFEVSGTVVRCYPDPEDSEQYMVAILFRDLDRGTFETIRTFVDFDNPLDED